MAALVAPPADVQDAPILYSTAKALKVAALAAGWHTANIRWGYNKDADTDLMIFRENVAHLRRIEVVPADGRAFIEKMMMAAAWEAANTRKGFKKDAALNHAEFEGHKGYLLSESIAAAESADAHRARDPSVLILEPDVVELLSSMIVSCAWFAANSRKGYDKDASRDLAELTRTFSCLYVRRRPKWLGVNLGGWLLLERGPSQPLFEETEAKQGKGVKLPDEEHGVCTFLAAKGLAESVFAEHREKHFTEADIVAIKDFGLNAVRMPFGYWCVSGPTEGDPYVGPALEYIDRVVGWCETHGLQILLDLHGNPGGESAEKPCGRAKRDWNFNQWRREESLQCLRTIAARYKDRDCVAGIQVANETNRTLDPRRLVDHYADCAAAIREAGMGPEKVAVVCPYFFYDPPVGTPLRSRFLTRWRERMDDLDHCVVDLHYYHFSNFNREEIRGSLLNQVVKNGAELDALPLTVVGEFSNAPPPGCSLAHEKFFEAQLTTYKAKTTHGLFFWCWKDGAGVEWSLRDVNEKCRAALLREARDKDASEEEKGSGGGGGGVGEAKVENRSAVASGGGPEGSQNSASRKTK